MKIFLIVLAMVFLYSCTKSGEEKMNDIILVEVQHFEGCPNGPKMIDSVKAAIIGLEGKVEFKEVLVETDELAREIGFRGSPTLLIDDEDFESMMKPLNASLSCRYYPNGVPSSEEIRKKILNKLD
jgi:hypothetical protein